MIMGNANIREGDLVEVFDRRPKGTSLLGFNAEVTQQTMTSFINRFRATIESELPKGESISTYKRNRYLGISSFTNVYYIWKVRHYLGPQGYWTKIYFKKQRDAVGTTRSKTLKTLLERAKKKRDDE